MDEVGYNEALLDVLKTPQLPNDYQIPDEVIYSITIGQNLSDFLRGFSNDETSAKIPRLYHFIWIDAVCINQADPIEKAAQISLMGDIYSNASLVIAWLGNAPPQLDTVVWMNDCLFPHWFSAKTRISRWKSFSKISVEAIPPIPNFG